MEKKNMRKHWRYLAQCGWMIGALVLAGCRTSPPQSNYAEIPDLPGTPIGVPANAVGTESAKASAPTTYTADPVPASPAHAPASEADLRPVAATSTIKTNSDEDSRSQNLIQIGDTLDITYSDTPSGLPPAHEKVREDGTITLMYDKTFIAAGKSEGELQREIRKAYVPDYFRQLTVSITRPEIHRVIFVDGEVRAPSKQEYTGRIKLSQAINTAGGFTDFANRRNIELIRANGKKEKFNYNKILSNPSLDPEVNPGDRIVVHRSFF